MTISSQVNKFDITFCGKLLRSITREQEIKEESDILLSIKILNSEIDLSYVRETSQKNNLYSSLVIFVNFVNRNYGEYISNRDISLIVSSHNSVMPKRSGHIYKYSKLFVINLYIKKLFYALIHLDLFTLKKIVYLPFIFLVSEYKNLRNN